MCHNVFPDGKPLCNPGKHLTEPWLLTDLILLTTVKSSKFLFPYQKAGVYNQAMQKKKKKAVKQTLHPELGYKGHKSARSLDGKSPKRKDSPGGKGVLV